MKKLLISALGLVVCGACQELDIGTTPPFKLRQTMPLVAEDNVGQSEIQLSIINTIL